MVEATTNYVCPSCAAVNRVPNSRLAEKPICGNCKNELFSDHPVELTDDTFEKFIFRNDVLVVVDFWAEWCGPCRMMAPAFAEATAELSPNMILAKLNTEDAAQTASRFNIQGIPCLIAFKHGQEVARQAGAMNVQQIIQWVSSL